VKQALLGALLLMSLAGCEGGEEHDERIAREKQAAIFACADKGMYPVLDPHYPTHVYCSPVPVCPVPR